jgi:hypothetical protein
VVLRDLLDVLRVQHLDDSRPSNYRWDDASLIRWLNEAEQRFARATRCFVDDSSDFCTITTTADTAAYAVDARIIRPVIVTNSDNLKLRPKTRGVQRVKTDGAPMYWEFQRKELILSPVPDDAYALTMTVERLPLVGLSAMDDEPEIADEYHIDLALYAAAQALYSPDVQSQSDYKDQADKFHVRWERRVTEARREFYQQRVAHNGTT